ncbi:MAG: 50S ribosomal protein L21 [Dehalococcoidia bacterium]|nr:50S ribosomal protein L21 [Dehalococcoidia bacterium]
MSAVVQAGGKQYRVKPGDVIDVELVYSDAGSTVELTDIRLVESDGQVTVDPEALTTSRVVAEVVENGIKGPKIVIGKFKAKTHFRRKTGHRQKYTRLLIKDVVA